MIGITQLHIAKALNVSRETVTKALQDHPKVSRYTKEKVRQMAEEMGYIPNFPARNLSSRKTKTIGVILPNQIRARVRRREALTHREQARTRGYCSRGSRRSPAVDSTVTYRMASRPVVFVMGVLGGSQPRV